MDFICQSADFALMMGNLALALQLIESAESIARGRERAVPEAGTFYKLKIFRAEHVTGGEETLSMARRAQEAFKGRHMTSFLKAVAITAWLERRKFGSYSKSTEQALGLFDTVRAHGLRALLTGQGFLD